MPLSWTSSKPSPAVSDMVMESGLVRALERESDILGSLSCCSSSSSSSPACILLYCLPACFLSFGRVSSIKKMLMMVVSTPRQAVKAHGSKKGLHARFLQHIIQANDSLSIVNSTGGQIATKGTCLLQYGEMPLVEILAPTRGKILNTCESTGKKICGKRHTVQTVLSLSCKGMFLAKNGCRALLRCLLMLALQKRHP